jgi:hypothetical protein
MTIYLYKKTHNKTGLQYLGKTKSSNPHLYQGSGTYWTDHINVHGYDVTTEILRECSSNEEVKEWGIYYSQLWNIVDERDEFGKKTWANLKEETGDGGWEINPFLGKAHSGETRQVMSEFRQGKTYEEIMGPKKAAEAKAKQSQKRKGNIPHNKGKTFEELYGDKAPEYRAKMARPGSQNGSYGKMPSHEQRARKRKEKLDTPKKVCYHCNKSIDAMNYARWHGDNCKQKGIT